MDRDPPRAIAAFFDLDRTLLSVNSGLLWARRSSADLPVHQRQSYFCRPDVLPVPRGQSPV